MQRAFVSLSSCIKASSVTMETRPHLWIWLTETEVCWGGGRWKRRIETKGHLTSIHIWGGGLARGSRPFWGEGDCRASLARKGMPSLKVVAPLWGFDLSWVFIHRCLGASWDGASWRELSAWDQEPCVLGSVLPRNDTAQHFKSPHRLNKSQS